MKYLTLLAMILSLVQLISCSTQVNPMAIDPVLKNTAVNSDKAGFQVWGMYDLLIKRDGSDIQVSKNRYADHLWGYHLNAVKLLEKEPCSNCISFSNIHTLPNGNVSIDVSITHPYKDPYCTAFDVRGIIMFPSSQYIPDNALREAIHEEPMPWHHRYARAEKGDAELVNGEGWTSIWAPDYNNTGRFDLDKGAPIFECFPGKWATGDNLGTLNPFIKFHSSDVRHMFEAGKTVKKTYIIKPPAEGDILASYAVYAHWAPPTNVPVTDPVKDFPPQANSPLPYEFWITQSEPIDPDAPNEIYALAVHSHIKTWDLDFDYWHEYGYTLFGGSMSGTFEPHPDGTLDDYWGDFVNIHDYKELDGQLGGILPGKWPFVFVLNVHDPVQPDVHLATDYYIFDLDIEAPDGIY